MGRKIAGCFGSGNRSFQRWVDFLPSPVGKTLLTLQTVAAFEENSRFEPLFP
jgi:hypothetical protein